MDERIKNIIRDIINCPQIGEYYKSTTNNCYEIIDFQKQKDRNNFQLPEPFSGNIDKAKILVISSNPSIDLKKFHERFPTCQWQENDIIEFFYNRFQNNIEDGTKVLQEDGTYSRAVSFYAHLKKRINEIFALNNSTAEPGIDYCLTEIVHCKSQKEKGVGKAINCCSKYLDRIIQLSPAPLLLIVGKPAKDYIFKHYDLTNNVHKKNYGPELKVCGPILIENKERMLYFIQHPNSHELRRIGKYLENPELKNWINENL